MDMQTDVLLTRLDEMRMHIETVKDYLRTGHDLTPDEVQEWLTAVENHQVVYKTMMLLLIPDPRELAYH